MKRFFRNRLTKFLSGIVGLTALSAPAASALDYSLGPEKILFAGGGAQATHIAFPHAALDGIGNLWLVYRKASTHAGGIGALWLAKYRAADMNPISNQEIYQSPTMDSRDPTITVRDGIAYIGFFQYNYTFNMVRQFLLRIDTASGARIGAEQMLQNAGIFNHSSSAPLSWQDNRWILPVYYVHDFYSKNTDVGYFSLDPQLKSPAANLTTIAEGAPSKSFFLEPALAMEGRHWISLFRTSPVSDGPGGVAPMMRADSLDGGKTWTSPRDTPFLGHHPRMIIDAQGRIWAGFRDLSSYDEKSYLAKITVWLMNPTSDTKPANDSTDSQPEAITVFQTTSADKNNWDCGYPSWLQIDEHNFRVIYYYARKGTFYLATRVVTLP